MQEKLIKVEREPLQEVLFCSYGETLRVHGCCTLNVCHPQTSYAEALTLPSMAVFGARRSLRLNEVVRVGL